MNAHFGNVDYKIKCVIAALNTFCPESAGSVENMTIEQIDSYIEDLQEAKRSLVMGKIEKGDGGGAKWKSSEPLVNKDELFRNGVIKDLSK